MIKAGVLFGANVQSTAILPDGQRRRVHTFVERTKSKDHLLRLGCLFLHRFLLRLLRFLPNIMVALTPFILV